jgi:hypothetical protein
VAEPAPAERSVEGRALEGRGTPPRAGNPGTYLGYVEVGGRPYAKFSAQPGTWVSSSMKSMGYDLVYPAKDAYGAYRGLVLDPEGKPLADPDRIRPGDQYLVPEQTTRGAPARSASSLRSTSPPPPAVPTNTAGPAVPTGTGGPPAPAPQAAPADRATGYRYAAPPPPPPFRRGGAQQDFITSFRDRARLRDLAAMDQAGPPQLPERAFGLQMSNEAPVFWDPVTHMGWHLAELATGETTQFRVKSRQQASQELLIAAAETALLYEGTVGLGGAAADSYVETVSILRDAQTLTPRRILTGRVLAREISISNRDLAPRFGKPDPYHNFPQLMDSWIVLDGQKVVRPLRNPALNSNGEYWQYELRGWSLNSKGKAVEGTFELGVEPSADGRVHRVTHRFFHPDG